MSTVIQQDSIDAFRGAHSWLSNMFECPCPHAGHVFASSEHLYQWLKVEDGPGAQWWRDKIRCAPHGKVAKKLAAHPKCPKVRPDCWIDFRLQIMEIALRAKFGANPDLRERLLATGDREIIEGNAWGDRFWGVCRGQGDNHLGRLLMRLREHYRSESR